MTGILKINTRVGTETEEVFELFEHIKEKFPNLYIVAESSNNHQTTFHLIREKSKGRDKNYRNLRKIIRAHS